MCALLYEQRSTAIRRMSSSAAMARALQRRVAATAATIVPISATSCSVRRSRALAASSGAQMAAAFHLHGDGRKLFFLDFSQLRFRFVFFYNSFVYSSDSENDCGMCFGHIRACVLLHHFS